MIHLSMEDYAMKVNGEKAHERKARLRREAEERQAARNLRSSNDQIAILRQRMGNSVKETARLAWGIELANQKAAEQVVAETAEMANSAAPPDEENVPVKLKAKERRARAKKGE